MPHSRAIDRSTHRCSRARWSTATAALLLGSALLAFALISTTPTLAQQENEVTATAQLTFEPDNITVTEGTTVTWVWEGGGFHTVTSTDSLEDHQPNGEYRYELDEDTGPVEHTFDEAGTYHYYCEPHSAQGMQGTVVVEAGEDDTPEDDDTPTEDDTQDQEDEEDDDPFAGEDPGDETETGAEEDTPGIGAVVLLIVLLGLVASARRST